MMAETNRSVGSRAGARLGTVWLTIGLAATLLGSGSPAEAQFCASAQPGVLLSVDGTIGPPAPAPTCLGAFYCEEPELFGPNLSVEFIPDPVDPTRQGSYRIRASFFFVAEGNNQNDGTGGTTTDFRIKFHVFGDSAPPADDCFPGINDCNPIGTCGIPGGSVPYDQGEVTVEITASCDELGTDPGQISGISLSALRCATPAGTCNTRADSAPVTLGDLGITCPPKPNCCEHECNECKDGVDLGAAPGAYCPADGSTGNARLAYSAGGPGSESVPGGAAWRTSLGRGWSHDYAERIVEAPDDSHVWLITRTGNFHEFWSPVGGVYQGRAPADEYRTLTRTASGWELRDLVGTVQSFGADGRWEGTADAAGNATTPSYDGAGVLTSVSLPNGRSETFSYHPDGKLAAITHVGVDALPQRTWSYTWAGDDLVRIDRPDGTAEEYFYNDIRFPSYMTRIDEVGTDASRRVKKGWEYDAVGNTVRTWRGETTAGPTGDAPGPGAVDVWTFGFDDPTSPSETLVTDPLGGLATYLYDRDPQSGKTRVRSISGDCPSCGLGPNVQFFYDDPVNQLLPTRMIDGRSTTTAMAYDANGQLISRTEALGTPLERTSTWEYADPAFPGVPTAMEQPSTSPGAVRRTEMVLDAAGNAVQRTISGVEDGNAFSYTTTTTYAASGRPSAIDPPGYGGADVTSYAYDPGRGNLVPLTRTDPLIGTTGFVHDALNRLVATTDPNGVESQTAYDAMDRVTLVIQKGATAAEDLVTENQYNGFGDLERTIRPRGDVIEYGYDAAGRLVSIARGPAAGVLLERIVYELDAVGNRTRESLQRWNGVAWESASETEFVYATRCLLDRTVRAPGTPEESVTEYAYDCEGNLESVWDGNHSSATDPPTLSFTYDELGRTSSRSQPWAGGGGGSAVTTYRYDVQDHLASVTDAEGNDTTYVYSDRDLLTRQVSAVSGTSSLTYNEHGEIASETDGRGVTKLRTVDALDRVTLVDTPENALDTSYTYDDPSVPFSKGRLTAITRNGAAIDYTYDRFGRRTRDGALEYSYDENGNRVGITYPGGVTASYDYDYADRQETLLVQDGTSTTNLVTAASYLPSGPLATAALGNGVLETRTFDGRYFPAGITAGSELDWTYAHDALGNVLSITDNLTPSGSRTYGYQDVSYFLTSGVGPWGSLSWTYDKIGGRLSETRDGGTSSYSYPPSVAGGHNPKLSRVTDAGGEATGYFYDAAGNRTYRSRDATKERFSYDASGRLSQVTSDAPDSVATRSRLTYDGRSFLAEATRWPFPGRPATLTTRPTYSSDGLFLHSTMEEILAADDPREGVSALSDNYVFYFAGRPVAILRNQTVTGVSGGSSDTSGLLYLTTDHLGTPVLATDAGGTAVWTGGFEPFGEDFAGAADAGVFLRFPGQWADAAWTGSLAGGEIYYNAHRWYEPGLGAYLRPDPIGSGAMYQGRNLRRLGDETLGDLGPSLFQFAYARNSPMRFTDLLGLEPCAMNPALAGCGPGSGCCIAKCLDQLRYAICVWGGFDEKADSIGALELALVGALLGSPGGPKGAAIGFCIGGAIGLLTDAIADPYSAVADELFWKNYQHCYQNCGAMCRSRGPCRDQFEATVGESG